MMEKLNKIVQILRIALGAILASFGILGILLGLLALVDPAGTQMADDGNPFGAPPTAVQSVLITLFYLLMSILGVSMIFGLKRLKNLFFGGPTTS